MYLVDHQTVTTRFKMFHSGCKINPIDSEPMHQAIEISPVCGIRRVALTFRKAPVFSIYFHNFGNTSPGQSGVGNDGNGVLLKPHHHIVYCHIQDTYLESITSLQRCIRCSLQPVCGIRRVALSFRKAPVLSIYFHNFGQSIRWSSKLVLQTTPNASLKGGNTLQISVLDMTVNNMMVRF